MPNRRATIIDVASEAGVSPKTVSRVLNNEPFVSEANQQRVKAAAAKLNYHPNINAQGLISKRSYLIGLTYEKPSPSYVVELQKGALERLENERYRLIVLPYSNASAHPEGIVPLIRSAGLDGVILPPPACDLKVVLDGLDNAGIPYARVSPCRYKQRGPQAMMDDIAAAREIAVYMLGLGHRKFGIIRGDVTHNSSKARSKGYIEAFAQVGLREQDMSWVDGDFTLSSGVEAASKLLDSPDRPTAILAQNDDMAAGALIAARERNIHVPNQLSITGFDDSEISRLAWPPITTVYQPVQEMARDAADQLLECIEGIPHAERRHHKHRFLVRGSTAPPMAAKRER